MRDQFGMVPKRRAIGYSKPYPDEYEMIPLPPKYRLPDFSKFSGSDGSSSIEHVSRYLAQLGTASVSDPLRVRFFSQSLTGSAFGWYTSLPPDSIRTWKQLEERFHMHIQLPTCGSPSRGGGETKFAGDQEVAVAEWTRGNPVSCKWVKPPGPPRGFDFDVTKTEQIFDLLLKEKQLTIPEGLKFPTIQELNGKPYCKWHNSFSHATNDCRVWRQQIQVAIEQGRLIFNQYAMKVDTQPFPAVNMVECTYPEGCQPGSSFSINMVGPGHHSAKMETRGCSRSKDRERPLHAIGSVMMESATSQRRKCNQKKKEAANVSVFKRLGPLPPQSKRAESPRLEDLEDSEDEGQEEEEDRYHRPGGALMDSAVHKSAGFSDCAAWRKPKGYTCIRRKARPDLAAKVQRTLDEEGRPRKMEWRPKQRKADDETSAGTNMVFILPSEVSVPGLNDALKVDDSECIDMTKDEVGMVWSTGLTM
ncbi:hypothetical protein QYE76_063860 [Lolium multiflorum]|uniref:Uncharacterized protein n=1 Tax=Lolium multiflorum TaxID=4521 RepID=A0AAD8W8M0_LOLMU|nr:hypothetical protein QYE76_063860 [Lolium multiflorum]